MLQLQIRETQCFSFKCNACNMSLGCEVSSDCKSNYNQLFYGQGAFWLQLLMCRVQTQSSISTHIGTCGFIQNWSNESKVVSFTCKWLQIFATVYKTLRLSNMSLELQRLQQVTDGYNFRKCVQYSLVKTPFFTLKLTFTLCNV